MSTPANDDRPSEGDHRLPRALGKEAYCRYLASNSRLIKTRFGTGSLITRRASEVFRYQYLQHYQNNKSVVKYLFKKSSKGEECAIATGINHADAWYPHCLLVSILGAPMQIHIIDLTIILAYFAIVVTLGVLVTKKMSKNIHWYFLGGNSLPW